MSLEKFINGILLIYFPLMVIKAPLLDLYMFLPATSSYGNLPKMRDYLKLEKPHFYVNIVWIDLLVKWPLCCNFFRYGYVLKTFYAYESLYTFMVFGLITNLIGLIPISSPIDHVRKKPSDGAKK
ncbi:hypothetical protein MKW92_000768 [Papaver armeniacum]|nr:hypothetical protein MKW92_000768 [Papaver armeniacum]